MTATPQSSVLERIEQEASTPGWLVVSGREIRDLWLTWRGPILLFAFSLMMSMLTYLAATNKDLNILDQRDTVNLVVKLTIGIGIAISLLVSADAISGERERGTLEMLLLTAVSYRQLAVGKLVAALSVWPAMVVIAAPYVWALRLNSSQVVEALSWMALLGALLTLVFAALGIIVSTFARSNRVSLAVSFFIFIALTAPTQLPGSTTSGWLGDRLMRINPVTATTAFLDRIIVSDHAWNTETSLLISPVVAVLVAIVLIGLLTPRLSLHGGRDA